MTIQRVTAANGRQYDIDLDDSEWDNGAVGQVPAPTSGNGRDDTAWAEMRRKAQVGEQAARELAFIRAGLDATKDPKIEDFMAVYKGDLDVAKIKEAAIARGYLAPPPDPGAPQQRSPEQQAALDADARISAAGSGAIPAEVDGETQLIEAYAAGGQAALVAKAAELGVPIAAQGDNPHHSDPVGWGA